MWENIKNKVDKTFEKVTKWILNKKVLLRECKRHTACCITSTRYAALSNPDLVGGYHRYWVPPWDGVPPNLGWGTPLRWGTLQTWDGVPPPDLGWGTPYLDLGWGTPLPRPGMGNPHRPGMGYLPPDLRWGTPPPDLGWGTPLPRPGMGYPPT